MKAKMKNNQKRNLPNLKPLNMCMKKSQLKNKVQSKARVLLGLNLLVSKKLSQNPSKHAHNKFKKRRAIHLEKNKPKNEKSKKRKVKLLNFTLSNFLRKCKIMKLLSFC